MKISVCIDAVYRDQNFAEAMEEVESAGVSAFEFWSWWDKDLEAIRKTQEKLGMTAAGLCTRFISLVDASKRDAYLVGLAETIQVARSLGCKTIISQVGDDLGISRREQRQSLIDGLKACIPMLQEAELQLVIEPLNVLVDHPGYYLTRSDEAFDIARAVDSNHVKVLFDIYHQQITEGNVIRNIVENIDQIGHFHAAGNPGRHELTIGELNYVEIFKAIGGTDYRGYVGLEYFPIKNPIDGIASIDLNTIRG